MNPEEVERHSGNRHHQPKLGELTYDPGFTKNGRVPSRRAWTELGEVSRKAVEWGLPDTIEGNPLGCGCGEAHLHAVGAITENGQIEADYMCDSGWHNFVIFNIDVLGMGSKNQLSVDKNGNLVESQAQGYDGEELQEY